jgi:uncharacterized protein (UPF0335 family)
MTETMFATLLTRIERLSAEKQQLADTVSNLRADRELLKRWADVKESQRHATGRPAQR